MKPSECEYISTCPYHRDGYNGQVIPEHFKEQYCYGIYVWCGRYLAYKAAEERKKRIAEIERA